MKGFEVIYAEKEFEVLRAGRDRFFLRLKGGLKYAAPALRRITRKEAETVIQEHIRKELKTEQAEAEKMAGQLAGPAEKESSSASSSSPMRVERRWI